MKKILIAGASGTAGHSLVRYFNKQKNVKVFGITSKPENAAMLKQQGAIPVIVDLTEENQTFEVLRKIQPDVVLSSVIGRGEQASQKELWMGKNLVQASVTNNVEVFGYVSVFQADEETGVPHFDVKAEVEEIIKTSGLEYVIIRPATFMDGLFLPWFMQPVKDKKTIVSPNNPEVKISYIHTKDVADVLGYALQQELLNKTYIVGGEPFSMSDLQRILTNKEKTTIGFQQLSHEQVEQVVGSEIARMVEYFNENGFEVSENILPKGYQPGFKRFEQEIDQYL